MSFAIRYVHTVTVETFQGSTSYGDSYAAPAQVICWCQEWADLNPEDRHGQEVNASATVFAKLSDLSAFSSGSKVTLPSGRSSWVLTTKVYDSGALNLPLDHIEVLIG